MFPNWWMRLISGPYNLLEYRGAVVVVSIRAGNFVLGLTKIDYQKNPRISKA